MTTQLWPVVIILDRYSGVYSGGQWLAFNKTYDQIDHGVYGDDVSCSDYFLNTYDIIGIGASPEAALRDLERRIANKSRDTEATYDSSK